MSINDVLYRIAHDYPGGIKALAARMGKNAAVLQNKVNPNCDTHHPYAEEAAQIADIADSDDLAKEHCARRNGVFVPLAQHQGASDMELLDLIIKMNKEESEMLQAIQKAMSDGVVDTKEYAAIKKESMEHVAANLELLSRIEGMVDDTHKTVRGK